MATDVNKKQLVINKLTSNQYKNIANPSPYELYLVPDEESIYAGDNITRLNNNAGYITKDSIIVSNTTAAWDSQTSLIAEENKIYIYTDKYGFEENGQQKQVPGVKFGRANTYLIDIPFVAEDTARALVSHINDSIAHVTQQDRDRWDSALDYKDPGNSGILEFIRVSN